MPGSRALPGYVIAQQVGFEDSPEMKMTIPTIPTWVRIPKMPASVRIAAVLVALVAVLELLFAIWWRVGVPSWLMTATAIALAPPLAYGAWWLWWRLPTRQLNSLDPPGAHGRKSEGACGRRGQFPQDGRSTHRRRRGPDWCRVCVS